MKEGDLEKLQRAMSKEPKYKTSTGFTGNAKGKRKGEQKGKSSAKQRKIDHLSRKGKRELWHLQNEFNQMWERNSNVSRKEEGKVTKKDVKEGVKAPGVWSISQYEKYQSMNDTFLKHCYENFGAKKLQDIKPQMVGSFLSKQLDKGNSAKTISLYLTSIKKMAEIGEKEGLKSFGGLVNKKHNEMVPEYRQEDYRRGHKGGYDIADVQKMASAASKNFSAYERAGIEVLGYGGTRLDEFRRVKWNHLDFENNRIMLTDQNMTKGARPRFIPIPPKTMERLKEIHSLGLHKDDNQRIWGSRMAEKDVRNLVKECAKLGGAKYSGVHDFRRSAVKYAIKQMEKEKKNGSLTKEKLVERIMEHVGVDEKLNPIINKTEQKAKIKAKNNKNKVKNNHKKGRKGAAGGSVSEEAVFGRKFIREELLENRMDFLQNLYLSQVLGHNRSDITAVYKKTKEDLQKK